MRRLLRRNLRYGAVGRCGGGEYGPSDPTSGYTGDNVYGYNLDGDLGYYTLIDSSLFLGRIDPNKS